MPGAPFVRGDRVTLRTVEEEDFEFLQRGFNNPEIRVPMTSREPKNLKEIESNREEQADDDRTLHLLVCRDGDPMGLVMVVWSDDRTRKAELAYWLVPEYQGEGYAREGVSLLIDHLFDQMNYHRVRARAIETNEASCGLLESLGFEREAVLTDEMWVQGEYVDTHVYGLLEGEWS